MTSHPPSPPRLALRLLERIVERDDDFGAAGDIEERYLFLHRERGGLRAALDCWRQVLAALPGYLRNQSYWSFQMLKSYIKIAFRNLIKHKGYSFINIAGLALGMACSLFILLWVQDELSFDRFHANAKTLYRVEWDQDGSQGKFHVNVTPYGMKDSLKAEIPEIFDTARSTWAMTFLLRQGEKAFYETRVAAVDPSFLKMFSFPVVRGAVATALADPGSVILTEDLARKYFGTTDPIGRTLVLNNQYPVTVGAVLKNLPTNTNLSFDVLLPMEFLKKLNKDLNDWGNYEVFTFVQLHDPKAFTAVQAKITRLVQDRTLARWRGSEENWRKIQADPEQWKKYQAYVGPSFSLMSIVDLRLHGYSGSDRSSQAVKTVTTFGAVGLFILLIACINFMNLATARAAGRAQEVGLRKVVGAHRRSIAGQFFGESILTAALAGLAAVALVAILLPAFNSVAGKTMSLSSLLNSKFILIILAVTAFTGVVAGTYPALVLSSFRPIKVIKGRAADGTRGAGLRRGLVVVQFSLSVLLLIGMAVAARQIDFLRSKKLGYDQEQLVYLPLRGETAKNYSALKERLLRDPKILGMTATNMAPTSFGSNGWGATWDGKDPNQRFLIENALVDFDYPETLHIEMAAGRSFDKGLPADRAKTFMINEALAKVMGLDPASAVGKRFNFMGVNGPIVGIMKDFHYRSVRQSIAPLAVIAVRPENLGFAIVRLKADDIPGSLDAAKAGWLAVNPQYPFDYRFFDQDFEQTFRADEQTGAILKIFAFLAIVLASLGLFGLASFTAEQKTREIGVRKVLGASAPGLVVLLSKEFAKWVLVANALAWPAAYFIMRGWLQQFAYRTNIAWWLFPAAGAGALLIAMITVSFQALRVAQMNPVKALKYE